jgi:hypothetical protein
VILFLYLPFLTLVLLSLSIPSIISIYSSNTVANYAQWSELPIHYSWQQQAQSLLNRFSKPLQHITEPRISNKIISTDSRRDNA